MSLHNEIMNLPVKKGLENFIISDSYKAYKEGHRDARHAAAELSLLYEPPVMERAHVYDLYVCLRRNNMTIPSETLDELKEFLLKFAK